MNYERMSNKRLLQLMQLRMPAVGMTGVDGSNRSTVIAFLKVSDGLGHSPVPKETKKSAKRA